MNINVERLFTETWERQPWLVLVAAVLALAALVFMIYVTVRLVRAVGSVSGKAKLLVGSTVVQAGVTWAVVTGTYEFGTKTFGLHEVEAGALALFLEAATWVTVAMILEHGQGVDEVTKQPNVGFGTAGPFFWLFSVLGGILAILAGDKAGEMIGRAVIVVFGTCLWYLTLRRRTRTSGRRSRFRWTPRRLFESMGVMEPEPEEEEETNAVRDWKVRGLARAIRWSNSRWPWSWLGARALVKRAEETAEDVIAEAQRRYAVAHLLVSNVQPDSEVMKRVIEDVKAGRGAPTDALLARTADAPVTQADAPSRGALTQHPDAALTQHPDAALTQHPDTPVTHSDDVALTHPDDPPVAQTRDAVRQPRPPAVTQIEVPPARQVRQVVMRRPVSAPPADDAERDAALRRAVDAVLTRRSSIRGAAGDAGLPEATVRRAVNRAKTEVTHINGHQFDTPTDDRAAV